jgi:hypothetical protein
MDEPRASSNGRTQKRLKLFGAAAVLLGIGILARAIKSPDPIPGQELTMTSELAQPAMMPTQEESWLRLSGLPEDATQVEVGAQIYYLVCSTCHGDHGQGLTDEGVDLTDRRDINCWQSKCHASNHPSDGFKLPHTIPPIVGPHMASKYLSAQELYEFVSTSMPWHAPGSLTSQEYWQVTAYVLYINGINLGGRDLNSGNAASVTLQ